MAATIQEMTVMITAATLDLRAFRGNTMTKNRSAAIITMKSTLAVTDITVSNKTTFLIDFAENTFEFFHNKLSMNLSNLMTKMQSKGIYPFKN